MAISAVGSPFSVTNSLSLSVSPTAVGDILFFTSSDYTVTGISGGGVTTWNAAGANSGGSESYSWWGVVTASGASTITVTGSGTLADASFAAQQFTGGGAGTWSADGSPGVFTGSGTTWSCPSLSATGSGELYVAGASVHGTVAGSTAGFTYLLTLSPGSTSWSANIIYNPNASGSALQPTGTNSPSAGNASTGVLLVFTPTVAVGLLLALL